MDNIIKFLHNISHLFPKGYPDLDNQEDRLLIESIILQEVNMNPAQLLKPFHESSEFFGQYKDRGERFLENIMKDQPFVLSNGDNIIIDKDKSAQAIELLKSKQYSKLGGQNKLFFDVDGKSYSLSNFAKTKEYGSGSGAGGGSEQTEIQESSQCLVNELAFKLKKGKIDKEDITEENLNKVYQFVDVTSTYEEMSNFILNNTSWLNTFIQTANILYSKYPNSNFTSHRGSSFVNKINNAFKTASKNEGMSLQINKWNPADIWLVDSSILSIEFKTNLDELNQQVKELYKAEQLIGVSLKKTGATASIEVFNDEREEHNYAYETYTSTDKSKMSTIIFNEGKIYLRSFDFADNFAGEIAGNKALAGKIGMGIINKFLKDNSLQPVPPTKDIRKLILDNDPKTIEELHQLFSKYIKNTSKEEFDSYLEIYNEDWRFSKYISLHIIDVLENGPQEKVNSFISDVVSYAKSSSSISSTFIKIS